MVRRLLKLPAVKDLTTLGTTSVYARVKDRTLPPPVKLTARSSAWVEDEIGAVNAAIIAGKSASELRKLVAALVAARTQQPAPADRGGSVAA